MKNAMAFLILVSLLNILVASAQEGGDEGSFENGTSESADNSNSDTPNVYMKNLSISGNGCHPWASDVAISPDGKSVSMLFDNFSVQSGDQSVKKRILKNCHLAIAISVPENYQVAIVKSDYRGYNYLPVGTQSKLISTYYISENSHKKSRKFYKRQKVFNGPIDEDFFVTAKTNLNKKWSKCGREFLLDIDTQLAVKVSANLSEDLYSGIDSLDVNSGHQAKYHLTWKKCHNKAKGKSNKKANAKAKSKLKPGFA